MAIMSPHISRERILGYGNSGCGKTRAMLDVIEATDSRVFVVDTDASWERMLEGKGYAGRVDVADVRALAYQEDVSPWEVTKRKLSEFSRGMGREDWMVLDMHTIVWTWCQNEFSEQVYGAEIDNYFVAARKRQVDAGKSGGNAFAGDMDWSAINRMWDKVMDAILNARGHVYVVGEMASMDVSKEKQEALNAYGALGGKPKGNKAVDHSAQTVIQFTQNIKQEFVLTTAKDRERPKLSRVAWGNFAEVYLKGVAGWKPKAVVEAQRRRAAAS